MAGLKGDEDTVTDVPASARELADPLKMAAVSAFLQPWRWMFHPIFHGLELIPDDRPLLFVGNHTLYGLVDIPLLFDELWKTRRIFLRGLADRGHYQVPLWRDLLTSMGAVLGTRDHCARLMRNREAVVVFPGGAREVFKRRDEKYKLLWKERYGFARLAVEHECTVVPFASVGVEEAWDIVFDRDDYLATPLGRLAVWLGLREEAMAPLARGIGPTPIPRPARIYFRILPPIRSADLGNPSCANEAVIRLQQLTHDAIERGIAELREEQGHDPEAVRFSTIFGPLAR
ncbi:MAG: lysophospholipid acyltransferase family protein [Candidatus Binatia bacterium]